jgi:hypothetical protein
MKNKNSFFLHARWARVKKKKTELRKTRKNPRDLTNKRAKKEMRSKIQQQQQFLINFQRVTLERAQRFIQNNNFLLINLKTNCLIKEMKWKRVKRETKQLHKISYKKTFFRL